MGQASTLPKPDAAIEADAPHSLALRFGPDRPLAMEAGVALTPLTIAYQTYGALNAAKSNAILVCHALTGDQHVANRHPVTGREGWWTTMVGPGRPLDTDRFFVICANVVGGCMGSTGPTSTNPETGEPYGLDLPVVTIKDMVQAQAMLIDVRNGYPYGQVTSSVDDKTESAVFYSGEAKTSLSRKVEDAAVFKLVGESEGMIRKLKAELASR